MKARSKSKIHKQSLGATAYDKIYRKIITLEYKPGQRLEEKQLMEHLGIGRTPIREALFRLDNEMMVESQPNKGCVVRPITLQNTKAVFEALRILELSVADLAIRQDMTPCLSAMAEADQAVKAAIEKKDVWGLVDANNKFHMSYARCSQNVYLVRVLHEVRCEAKRLAYLSYSNEIGSNKSLKEHYESVIRQHEEIMTFIRERDEARLKETICEHIRIFQQRIMDYMTS